MQWSIFYIGCKIGIRNLTQKELKADLKNPFQAQGHFQPWRNGQNGTKNTSFKIEVKNEDKNTEVAVTAEIIHNEPANKKQEVGLK